MICDLLPKIRDLIRIYYSHLLKQQMERVILMYLLKQQMERVILMCYVQFAVKSESSESACGITGDAFTSWSAGTAVS